MGKMRAKMRLNSITTNGGTEELVFNAVAKPDGYPSDGADEDNTYARWTPTAEVNMTIANPALVGTFKAGELYYVDFTLAEDVKAIPGPHEPPRPPGSNPVA